MPAGRHGGLPHVCAVSERCRRPCPRVRAPCRRHAGFTSAARRASALMSLEAGAKAHRGCVSGRSRSCRQQLDILSCPPGDSSRVLWPQVPPPRCLSSPRLHLPPHGHPPSGTPGCPRAEGFLPILLSMWPSR